MSQEVGAVYVVVTGGSGQIGSWVCRELQQQGHRVVNVDRRPPESESRVPYRHVEVADVGAMCWALEGADAVVHLAAIPAPGGVSPQSLYLTNVGATFAVLHAASLVGVIRAVIASSISILGLAYSPRVLPPAYLPVDEAHPLVIEDPYALSKAADENTAGMFHRLGVASVLAMRFHGVIDPERVPGMMDRNDADPGTPWNIRGLWGYVDARDVAQACRLAVETDGVDGYHVLNICAPDTNCRKPTAELVERWLPDVEVRTPLDGRQGLWDIDRARRLLGYDPHWYEG